MRSGGTRAKCYEGTGTRLLHNIEIKERFRIGFDYGKASCNSAKCNLLSAVTNSDVVRAYLRKEVMLGRVLDLLQVRSVPGVQVSHFDVIPKGHTPGKWRPIVASPPR